MATQNTPNTPTPTSVQAPAAPPEGYDAVVVKMPPQGETTTIAVVPGTEYQMEAPDVSFAKDGNNLVAHAPDGGTVVFEDYFTFASSELPPALTLADGAVIPQEQIMAELGNPDLNAAEPAAGPGAGAGATGGLNGGGAAFAAYDPGDIGTGLSTLDLLGNLDLAFAPPPPLEDPGLIDFAEGTLSIDITTSVEVDGITYAGAFEDNMPHGNVGDSTVAVPVLNVVFTPADDEVVTQTTLSGFPVGVQLTLTDGTVIDITAPDQQVVLAGGLETGIQITALPPNSDANFDVTAVVEIQDTSTGLQTASLTVTGTVVVDAVADQAAFEVGNVTANEDNATATEGLYTDGQPRFDVGFAANATDTDGSEEIVSVSMTISQLQTTEGVGFMWNGAAIASGDHIDVPASIYGGVGGETVSMLVTITTDPETGSMVVTLTSDESGADDAQILSVDLAGLQVVLPQHSDDDFHVVASVTTSETNLTDTELTLDNNTATQTHSFDVAVLAVADVATDLGAASATMSGAALVVSEDHTITPTFTANFADNDGSEVHTLVLTIPVGWTVVSAGAWTLNSETGNYELDVTSLGENVSVAGPELQPPTDSDVDSTLTLTAISTETTLDGAAALVTAEATATYTVIVDADADEPSNVTASASLSVTTTEGECQVRNVSDWKDVGINVAGVVVTYSTVLGSTAADAASNLVLTTAQGETAVSHATGWGVNEAGGTNVHEVDSLTSTTDSVSEAIKMTFDSPASSVTVNFGLLFGGLGSDWHPESTNVEKAIILAYDADGKLVATGTVTGDQDGKVSYTLDAPEGTSISTVYVVATNSAGESNYSDFIVTGAGYTPATDTVITEAATVTITASATFGDVLDGSEDHYILVEVPAGSTNVTADGVAVVTFTIGAGGDPAYPGVAAGTYVQVLVNDQLGAGDTSATVQVSFTAPNVTENTSYSLDTYGMAVETVPASSGLENSTGDNVAIVAGNTVVVDVADTLPTIVGADTITVSVAEGPTASNDHGAITFDFGADTTGSTVAFTNAAGQVLTLTGANGSEQVTVISNTGSTMVVADADGNDITLKITTATNSCGLVVATITATLPAGDAFDHLSDGNTESVLTISGINVTGTDNEGTDSVTGHVSVAVTDDLPTLTISSTLTSYAETTSASGALHVDAGADELQAISATVNGVAVVLTHTGDTYTGTSAFGTLTLNPTTGTWTLSNLPNLAADTAVTVAVTATDKDNDTSTQSTSFTVTDAVPSIVSGNGLTLHVEEGDVASADHGAITFAFGTDAAGATVAFDYHIGDAVTLTGASASESLTVQSISADGTSMTLSDGHGNTLTMSISLGAADADGHVTATVTATLPAGDAFDHLSGNGANTLTIDDVKLVGTDGDTLSGGATADTVSATVDVAVLDDLPSASGASATITETVSVTPVNVVLMLDLSGSMTDKVDTDGNGSKDTTRLDLLKQSVSNLLASYGSAVAGVMITTFSDNASTTGWLSATAALSWLASVSNANGNTDFDSALASLQSNYTANPNGAETVVYFLSDGEATGSDGGNSNAISGSEKTSWQNFLQSHSEISNVYAVGVGTDSHITYSDGLQAISWSRSGPDADSAHLFKIIDNNDLAGTVDHSGPAVGAIASVSGTLVFNPGADGGAITELHYTQNNGASVTSAMEGGHLELTINYVNPVTGETVTYGTLAVNPTTGEYLFTPAAGVDVNNINFDITYTVKDADGDTASAHLTLNFSDLSEVSAVNDTNHLTVGASLTTDTVESTSLVTGGESSLGGLGTLHPSSISWFGDDIQTDETGSFAVSAGQTATITTKVNVSDYQSGDTVKILIEYKDSNGDWHTYTGAGSSQVFTVNGNNQSVTLTVSEPGTYRVVLYGDDDTVTWQGLSDKYSLDVSTSAVKVNLSDYVKSVTNSVADVDWVAAAAIAGITGNVLTNDALGSEGAHVAAVNGSAVSDSGETIIHGAFGDLHIAADGSYTYDLTHDFTDNDFHGTDAAATTDTFSYTVAQNDGDSAIASLTIDVSQGIPSGSHVYAVTASGSNGSGDGHSDANYTTATDYIFGTMGNDLLHGGAGDDYLNGGDGNDTLYGDAGNDQLIGGAGNDSLSGGSGNDLLNGGTGNDVLAGGSGADTFQFNSVADGHDTITDFQVGTGGDTIDLDALFDALGASAANTEVTVTPVSGSATEFTIGLADATTHVAVHTEFSIDVHTTTDTDAATIKAQVDTHGS
jgi:large repetitive protein